MGWGHPSPLHTKGIPQLQPPWISGRAKGRAALPASRRQLQAMLPAHAGDLPAATPHQGKGPGLVPCTQDAGTAGSPRPHHRWHHARPLQPSQVPEGRVQLHIPAGVETGWRSKHGGSGQHGDGQSNRTGSHPFLTLLLSCSRCSGLRETGRTSPSLPGTRSSSAQHSSTQGSVLSLHA